jgi:alkanesulfonate monooxygenase SsuD/methylene tetrahydromethanopterin reductase-like flavin-dependent oxidoreductase (luciferase family)
MVCPSKEGGSVHVGLKINQEHLAWSELVARVQFAEELGFRNAWIFDHFKAQTGDPAGPCLESWSLLAGLAAVTRSIRLGALATGVMWRRASVFAAQAVTIDHISVGRLEIALGAAWDVEQHRVLGVPFPSTDDRVRRLGETVDVIRLLMTTDRATYHGEHFELENATYRPRPVQRPHPPIWIAAGGDRLMVPLAARQADVWHCFEEIDQLARKVEIFNKHARAAGRDPETIGRAANLDISASDDEIMRTADQLHDLGFSDAVVPWPASGARRVEEFAGRLLPTVIAIG